MFSIQSTILIIIEACTHGYKGKFSLNAIKLDKYYSKPYYLQTTLNQTHIYIETYEVFPPPLGPIMTFRPAFIDPLKPKTTSVNSDKDNFNQTSSGSHTILQHTHTHTHTHTCRHLHAQR